MLTFVISGPLRELADNRSEVRVDGSASSLGDALSLLWSEWPAFRDRVVTEVGELRPHFERVRRRRGRAVLGRISHAAARRRGDRDFAGGVGRVRQRCRANLNLET